MINKMLRNLGLQSFLTVIGALGLVALPGMALAQATVSLSSTTAVFDSGITVSGSCPTADAGGEVDINLTRGGSTAQIGTATVAANGSYSATAVVPASFGAGDATLTAVCPGGDTATASLTVVAPSMTTLTLSDTTLDAGQSVTLSGVCPSGDVGEMAVLAVADDGTTFNLGNVAVGSGGAFNATITVPTANVEGNVTFVATCPTGNNLTAAATVAATDGGITPGPGGAVDEDALGGGEDPVGGVDAGYGNNNANLALAALLALAGTALLVNTRTKVTQ